MQHAQSSWPLTSVGDKKDDILIKGLRACQSHLSTNLLHHIQGHLEWGDGEAVPAELTSVPQPPQTGDHGQSSPGPLYMGKDPLRSLRIHLMQGGRTAFGV